MDFSSYELPGVYVREIEGPSLVTSVGGNAVMALVGTSIGYRTASKLSTLPTSTDNGGVAGIDGMTFTDRTTGAALVGSTTDGSGDLLVSFDADSVATVRRQVKYASSAIASEPTTTTDYNVGQSVDLTDEYLVWGTVGITVEKDGTTYTLEAWVPGIDEDTGDYDYLVNYTTGEITWNPASAVDGDEVHLKHTTDVVFGDNASISFHETELQPVFFSGTVPQELYGGYAALSDASSSQQPTLFTVNIAGGTTTMKQEDWVFGTDFDIDDGGEYVNLLSGSSVPSYDAGTSGKFPVYIAYPASGIKATDIVQITYQYTPADYYTPQFCTSWADVKSRYGSGWASDGSVNSEVSRAAWVAFQNGCPGMWISPVGASNGTSSNADDWDTALSALDMVTGIKIIVPVTGSESIQQQVVAYANSRTIDEDECRTIVGMDGTGEVVPTSRIINIAQRYSNERVCVVSPSTILMANPMTANVETVPGYLIAAAVAGYSSSVPQYTPLTNKNLAAFYGNSEYRTKSEMKNEIASGVMYCGTDTIKIVHGVTTDTTLITRREYNVSITKDFLFSRLRDTYQSVIGSPMTSRTLSWVDSLTGALLSNLVDAGYINDFNNVLIEQDATELTKINVSFSYQPVFSVNYIEVTFVVDTSSTL